MPSALVGAVSCDGCGAPIADAVMHCGACGVALLPAAPGSALEPIAGPTTGLQPARALERAGVAAVDLISILAPAGGLAAILLGPDPSAEHVVALAALTIFVLAAQGVWFTRSGRSLGRAVLGLRSVDDLVAEPPRLSALLSRVVPSRRSGRIITVNIRTGRDPLTPTPIATRALTLDGARATSTPRPPARGPRRDADPTPSVILELDTGEKHELSASALVGRAPERRDGDTHLLLAWPDLGRTLSKTHALIEWSGSVLWVTDLNSTNGTVIVSPSDDRQLLAPGVRAAAAIGWTIAFADRSMRILPGPGASAA